MRCVHDELSQIGSQAATNWMAYRRSYILNDRVTRADSRQAKTQFFELNSEREVPAGVVTENRSARYCIRASAAARSAVRLLLRQLMPELRPLGFHHFAHVI